MARASASFLGAAAFALGVGGKAGGKVLVPGTPSVASTFQYSSGLKLSISFFAVVDEADGHALHAACRQAPADFAPQEGAELVAHQTVQHAAGLLGVEQVFVDGAGVGHALLHALFGDLVKGHAVGGRGGPAPGCWPGCQLMASPFTVRVGREDDAVGCAWPCS